MHEDPQSQYYLMYFEQLKSILKNKLFACINHNILKIFIIINIFIWKVIFLNLTDLENDYYY